MLYVQWLVLFVSRSTPVISPRLLRNWIQCSVLYQLYTIPRLCSTFAVQSLNTSYMGTFWYTDCSTHSLTIKGILEFSKWYLKILQADPSEVVKCVGSSVWRLQLCMSIPETLLHVTLKRRAEISADTFARLSRYFRKNLTIIRKSRLSSLDAKKLHCTLKIVAWKIQAIFVGVFK